MSVVGLSVGLCVSRVLTHKHTHNRMAKKEDFLIEEKMHAGNSTSNGVRAMKPAADFTGWVGGDTEREELLLRLMMIVMKKRT